VPRQLRRTVALLSAPCAHTDGLSMSVFFPDDVRLVLTVFPGEAFFHTSFISPKPHVGFPPCFFGLGRVTLRQKTFAAPSPSNLGPNRALIFIVAPQPFFFALFHLIPPMTKKGPNFYYTQVFTLTLSVFPTSYPQYHPTLLLDLFPPFPLRSAFALLTPENV